MAVGEAGGRGGRSEEDRLALCRSGAWAELAVARLRSRGREMARLLVGRSLMVGVECGGFVGGQWRFAVSSKFVSLVSPTNLLATDFVADVIVSGEPEALVDAVTTERLDEVCRFADRLSAEDRDVASRFLRFAVDVLRES